MESNWKPYSSLNFLLTQFTITMTQRDAIDDGICYYFFQEMKLMGEPTNEHTEKIFMYYVCIYHKVFPSNFYLTRNKNFNRISLFTQFNLLSERKRLLLIQSSDREMKSKASPLKLVKI